ncbi:hypothetical protein C3709_09120 [Lelliottia aquatilis]|uniref:Uncharacterized protein n=1 Tax=Lelliottia aquatilis TaxID=2080838 RepID=A0ABX5A3C3_9ENTR|nr:hypothetical protein C3712_09120 [Lelliottia aquatilis]POZ26911.1 hypothetical protein C3708_09120 [Lelliottia sp. 7254-16]POZ27964.1 hypothetical protein C3711_07740 [Lelliottia aquatilis]POZ32682.1 hypothetical protein C3710_10500 [Lelliottia aquatilis]POZ38517.1 hypothetical protein C3709_09120 [Lelliottia aquatilis]
MRADALTPALSHREREQTLKTFSERKSCCLFLRDFFFHRWVEEKRIGPLRLNVAERKHGGE